ncbi:hypothetical protein WG906_02125 [Pedobacter sp. P351]|uniref:hypothetical protein n=1 Tax=Pedobacter superstes TaxID=3133441 RepID=UPI0030973D7B
MKKLFFIPVLLLFILTACEKNETDFLDDEKTPAASTSLSRSFYYPEEDLTLAQTYVQHINPLFKFDENDNLVLDFDVPYTYGHDDVTLIINKNNLKEGYSGTYNITSSPASDVAAYYLYRITGSSSNRFLPGNSTGSLKILAYDSRFKTFTGNYNFTINSINDPVSSAINNFKETTISISGSFENIKLK